MKKISLVSSCYNEQDNIDVLYEKIKKIFDLYADKYEFEYILIDNASVDNTAQKLRELAQKDKRIKVILNARNFGQVRSPHWGLMQAYGDCAILLASDLQDPPELIEEFIKRWEEGYKIVLGRKTSSEENKIMYFLRKMYYSTLSYIADDETKLVQNCTGFGLYDRKVLDIMRSLDDPYPYLRGLICEIGFEKFLVDFKQPKRKRGKTKNNFYTLYDIAMSGLVKHSKFPLRLMTFVGFIMSFVCLAVSIFYLIWKLLYWEKFEFGLAPVIISVLFLGSIQLFCMGILGEYIGAIYTRVNKKPLVIEKERINF